MNSEPRKRSKANKGKDKPACLMCDKHKNLCPIHSKDKKIDSPRLLQKGNNEESKETLKKYIRDCESEITIQSAGYISEIEEVHNNIINKMKNFNKNLEGNQQFQKFSLDPNEIPFVKDAIESSTSSIKKPLLTKIESLESDIEKKNEEINDLHTQSTNLNSTVLKLEQGKKCLQSDIEKKNKDIRYTNIKLKDLNSTVMNLEQGKKSLELEIKNKNEEISDLKSQVTSLNSTVMNLEQEIKSLKKVDYKKKLNLDILNLRKSNVETVQISKNGASTLRPSSKKSLREFQKFGKFMNLSPDVLIKDQGQNRVKDYSLVNIFRPLIRK